MDENLPIGESPNQVEQTERIAFVTRIKELFENASSQEALEAINTSPETFVNSLIEAQKYDIHLSNHVLQLFRRKTPGEYISTLLQSLHSTTASVRRFAIEQIYYLTKEDAAILNAESYVDGFTTIAHLVGDKDASVFNKAILIMSELDVTRHPQVLNGLRETLKGDKTSKCNAFDVIVNMSNKSEQHLERCANEGFIDLMVDELVTSTDILYQLNILELLTRLVVTPHGFAYFTQREIFESISNLVPAVTEHPMRSLLLPGYLKFFGSVAHLHPSGALRYYSSVVECLFDTLESGDKALLPVALDTLGYVGSTVEGKLSLTEIGAKFQSVIVKVGEYIRNSPTEIKVRSLACLESLIGLEGDSKYTSTSPLDLRITLMTREWFRTINPHGNPMEYLYEMCKNPFPDIRLAAFGLLDAVCQHKWGNEMVANTPGFIEYLLDRSVDHTKGSKEAKYNIIKRLSQSTAFDPTVTVKMTDYLEQGVFFTQTGLEVAMEEGN